MRFGVHLSISKGFLKTIEEAKRLCCDTIQIFTRSPRMWRARLITPDDAHVFCRQLHEAHIHPLVVHTPYLPNLCTSNKELYQKSLNAFQEDVSRAELFKARYLVIHPGAYSPDKTEDEGYENLLSALDSIFSPDIAITVLLENMAGGGRRLGNSFEKLAWIFKHSKISHRLGVCLDTCHAVGAGFDLSQKKGIEQLVGVIDKTVGFDRIKLLHINDSKTPPGSQRDRHEHIGRGYIGNKGFRMLLTHPTLKDLPAILETPKDAPDADKKNLALVRKLAKI